MSTVLIIADFEMSFTTSFKHTAHVKWGVSFENSNIQSTLNNLHQLKHNMQNGTPKPVHVGYEITVGEVERVEALIRELLDRWKQSTNIPPPPKLYRFLQRLRELATPTAAEQAKAIVKEIITPKPSPNHSKEEQKQGQIDAVKEKRRLDMLRKQNRKH